MIRAYPIVLLLVTALAAACSGDGATTAPSGNGDPIPPATFEVSNDAFTSADASDPHSLTVPVNTTVTWTWTATALGHNIVPDDGVTPAPSGGLANAPHIYQFTFTQPGTFRFYCAAHGAPGGVGMSGRVIVQ